MVVKEISLYKTDDVVELVGERFDTTLGFVLDPDVHKGVILASLDAILGLDDGAVGSKAIFACIWRSDGGAVVEFARWITWLWCCSAYVSKSLFAGARVDFDGTDGGRRSITAGEEADEASVTTGYVQGDDLYTDIVRNSVGGSSGNENVDSNNIVGPEFAIRTLDPLELDIITSEQWCHDKGIRGRTKNVSKPTIIIMKKKSLTSWFGQQGDWRKDTMDH